MSDIGYPVPPDIRHKYWPDILCDYNNDIIYIYFRLRKKLEHTIKAMIHDGVSSVIEFHNDIMAYFKSVFIPDIIMKL